MQNENYNGENVKVAMALITLMAIGFILGAVVMYLDENRIVEDKNKVIAELQEELVGTSPDCVMNRQDVRDIMYSEIEDIIETKAVLDGAMGEPTFVPMLKRITSPDYHK